MQQQRAFQYPGLTRQKDVMLCYSCQQFAALQANSSGLGQQR